MVVEKINADKLYQLLHEATNQFLEMVSSFDEREINLVPFDGSWTAGQIAEHVTLSNNDIVKQLSKPGKICRREPDAGVENIKSIFLNFTEKLKSPGFILPTRNWYNRETLIANLAESIRSVRAVSTREDLFRLIDHTVFGEVTRYETLYFVVYHTQRHIHQLRNIQTIIAAQK